MLCRIRVPGASAARQSRCAGSMGVRAAPCSRVVAPPSESRLRAVCRSASTLRRRLLGLSGGLLLLSVADIAGADEVTEAQQVRGGQHCTGSVSSPYFNLKLNVLCACPSRLASRAPLCSRSPALEKGAPGV